MTRIAAALYPPDSSARIPVELELEAGELRILGDDVDRRCAIEAVTFSSRVGNVPRTARLPDGAKCEIADNDAVDAWLRAAGIGRGSALVHVLETHYRFVAVATLVAAIVAWAFVQHGIPGIARTAAFALPAAADAKLGQDGLDALDDSFLVPTTLSARRQAELDALFTALVEGLPAQDRGEHPIRLVVRGGGELGANAFALPGGVVIVTDELLALAEHDDEVRGVLAHEIGHVVHRHGLQRLLRSAVVVLALGVITGDMASFGSLAVTIPAVLIETGYSRDFEREADAFAVRAMRDQGIPAAAYSTMLRRLEQDTGEDVDVPGLLSTHPGTAERIEAIERGPAGR